MESLGLPKPKTSTYVMAWMIMGTINVLAAYSISYCLPFLGSELSRSAAFWQFFVGPLYALVPILGFYLTYRVWFNELNGWRVLPWIYVIGTFSFMGGIGNSLSSLTQLLGQEEADVYGLTSMISLAISFGIIRNIIVAKSGHVK